MVGKRMYGVIMLVLVLITCLSCGEKKPAVNYLQESSEERAARMQWWQEARFGMFIHWGLYAIPAGEYNGKQVEGIGEWIMNTAQIPVQDYEKFAPQFNPVKFNADEWVALAKEAGVKYIVITSKHHDGFAIFDSKVTKWDVMDATPFKRDILKELSVACENQGITLCFYHSIMDWHHPQAQASYFPNYNDGEKVNPEFPKYVKNHLKPQLKELLTNYGKVGILWFDGEWNKDWTSPMGKDLYNYVRNLQPDIIINNRVDKGRMGMQGLTAEGEFAGDYGTPEQEIPDTGLPGVDWESCMTMNDTWGYKASDNNWKSAEMLIRNLVDIASKGGNYLLNVGPTAEGLIPEASVERLKAIGAWMKVNGDAVYGTSASPFAKPEWGRYTQKPGKLFAIVFEKPKNGLVQIPVAAVQVKNISVPAAPDLTFKVKPAGDGISLQLPKELPDKIATVIVIEYDGELVVK
ncbi:MAG TPA: alpha-L-fucosidase [bacterium]|nr:alpha-L-fucosidase [bacterium]HPN42782.1 alpha-L-fucosidase [bacterium]